METRRQTNKGEEGMGVSTGHEDTATATTVDWRGRPSNPEKHGGMRAASFVLGLYLSLAHGFGSWVDVLVEKKWLMEVGFFYGVVCRIVSFLDIYVVVDSGFL